MPQRFLRPGIRTSSRWNDTSFLGQSLYIGILTLVDDFGRYDGRSKLLHGEIFILRSDVKQSQTTTALGELDRCGLIQLYQIDGKEYLQVLQWQERTRCDKSKFPDPPQRMAADGSGTRPPSPSSTPSPLHPRPNVIASTQLRWSEAESWSGKSDSLIEELKTAYPACDISRQFLEMEQWLRANPVRAHKTNWRRFVDNWLRKKQDRGGDRNGSNGTAMHPSRPRTLSFVEVERRIMKIRERRNDMFKMRTDRYTGAEREFTAEEQDKYDKLTEELTALEG